MKASLLRNASLLHRANQNSVAILGAEEISQLRSEVLDHQPAAHGRMHYYYRNRHIDTNIRHRRNRRDRGDGRHDELKVSGLRSETFPVRKLRLESARLAIAADFDVDHATAGNFADHAPQLLHTFDFLSIDAQDDVVLFDAGLSSRSVLVHHGHFHAALLL